MADPTTVNTLLSIPLRGSNVGTWDTPVNSDFVAVDGFLGGVQTISVAGTNITLTAPAGTVTPSGGPTQAQNAVLKVDGLLTANVQITLPLPGYMIIDNTASNNFVVTFRAVGSGEIIAVEGGSVQHIYNDGTNVRFVNLPPVGTYLDVCDATVPAWITACTKPPYLNCDGSTFNATTYKYLNAKLGGNTLPDIRGGSRATLNQGTGRITTAGSGIDGNTRFSRGGAQSVTLSTAQIPIITPTGTITVALNGTSNLTNILSSNGVIDTANTGVSTTPIYRASNLISIDTTASYFTGTPFGGGQSHTNMGPTTISGLTLIRAA